MRQPIYILHGLSSNNVFLHWEMALRDTLRKMGIQSQIIRADADFSKMPQPVITFGFDMVRNWSKENSEHLHIIWEVDHPVYMAEFYMPQFSQKVIDHKRVIVFCVDRKWCNFARNYYHFQNIFFLPHCSTLNLEELYDETKSCRNSRIIICGTFVEPSTFLDKLRVVSGKFWDVLKRLVDGFRFDGGCSLDVSLYKTMLSAGLSNEQAIIAVNAFLPDLAHYHGARTRNMLLKSIKNHKVDIFGKVELKSFSLPSNFTVMGQRDFSSMVKEFGNYSILINNNPTLMWGGHERIFEALARGCAVITTESHFLKEEFQLCEAIAFYNPEEPVIVNELIEKVLDNEEKIEAHREFAKSITFNRHLIKNRAHTIVETFNHQFKSFLE